MAEENKTSTTAFEDMGLALLALLLVGQMFQRGPEILSERLGIDIGNTQYLVAGVGLSSKTPLGSRVNAPNGAIFYGAPGSKDTNLGSLPPGSSLVLIGGPETVAGERWWQVEDSKTGKKGWVSESTLILDGVGGLGPVTKIGSRARVLLDTTTWESPGGLVKAGLVKKGDWGELTKGPKTENGSRWWFFDKDSSSEDGWLPEAVLLLSSETGWKEGSSVKGRYTTDIFERAGGGQIVGFSNKDGKAKILGGPVEVGGEFWWLIKTDTGSEGWVPENALEDGGMKGWFKSFFTIIMIVGTVLTLGLLAGILYVTIRTNQIRARELQKIKNAIPKKNVPRNNDRWNTVMEHANSENPSDWRLAIIESDIILDELLTRTGYEGQSLGEKLKQVTKGDVKSIDLAWEAHKVRNQIAHEGGDFILTQRETKRVVNMYATIFAELKYL
jgi:hypothetical protein